MKYTMYIVADRLCAKAMPALDGCLAAASPLEALVTFLRHNEQFAPRIAYFDYAKLIAYDIEIQPLIVNIPISLYTIDSLDFTPGKVQGEYTPVNGTIAQEVQYGSISEMARHTEIQLFARQIFKELPPQRFASPEALLEYYRKNIRVGCYVPELHLVTGHPNHGGYCLAGFEAVTIPPALVERYGCGGNIDRAEYLRAKLEEMQVGAVTLMHAVIGDAQGSESKGFYHQFVVYATDDKSFHYIEPSLQGKDGTDYPVASMTAACEAAVQMMLAEAKMTAMAVTIYPVKVLPPYGCTLKQFIDFVRLNNSPIYTS